MLGTHVRRLGGDDGERLAASFDLPGHLAPGAHVAEVGVHAVGHHVALREDTQDRNKEAAMKKKFFLLFLVIELTWIP